MTDIVSMVKEDLENRAKLGEQRYGDRLRPGIPGGNDLTGMQNAYEEILDFVCYFKQAMLEWEAILNGQDTQRPSS
jgi:hypothetical protein|tara:strand:+ start:279 stop:506 length:228 start_codon:yes stop_codon:yes gene_type:complete